MNKINQIRGNQARCFIQQGGIWYLITPKMRYKVSAKQASIYTKIIQENKKKTVLNAFKTVINE